MKIQIVSDLHLEFADINIPNAGADVLILSGDILTAIDLYKSDSSERALRFRSFLTRCSDSFAHVVYVAGNHEFYRGRWNQTLDILTRECDKFSNIYFLEDSAKIIDGISFVGGTLWTDMNKNDPGVMASATGLMNDYSVIRKDLDGYSRLRPRDTVTRHYQTLQFIKDTVDRKDTDQYVVVTHHTPSWLSCHPSYAGDVIMNACYHSELSETILDRPQIRLWTHGHTHYPWDYVLGDTRIVCNPRGYDKYEKTGWDPGKIVEI